MSDYHLERLGTREFEHVTRALTIAAFGAAVRPFGEGKDGGREATFEGLTSYPEPSPPSGHWDGYVVIQAKFRQRPSDVGNNAIWLQGELQKEIKEWKDKTKRRRIDGRLPEYLLFTTNVFLSAVPKSGGVDTINDFLKTELTELGVKGWDIWDGDKICALLDLHEGVRNRYKGFLSAGDLIAQMQELLGLPDGSLESLYKTHTIKSLRHDQWVRLGESGGDPTTRLPLSQVAIDLPVLDTERRLIGETPAERRANGALNQIVALGDNMLRPADTRPDLSNVLILGGPGQGKSTLSQLLSQTYRLAFLEDYPDSKLDPAERNIRRSLSHHIFAELGIPKPSNRRWPFTIKLSEFGDAVAGGENTGVLRFMASKMTEMSSDDGEVTPAKLKKWLAQWPWILILDGLDEVPTRAARERVFEKVADFLTDARQVDADLFVVATTRPQGYAGEMNPEEYKHLVLAPLAPSEALSYVGQLSAVQYADDDELRVRVNEQASEALRRDATSKLMVTPLQVTIMSLLLAKRISLPESRHELFNSYFSTIYEREMNKSHSHLAKLLRGQRRNVEFVHQRVGLALQQKAEAVGHADALLTVEQFESVIEHRLREDEKFSEADTARIKKDLSEAALDRLVLLVPRVAGHVGFELRSLQEFMAASFFFSQGEQYALQPFEATAHSTHWRHSWLLGAGRLFEEHQTLRDGLLALVDDIGLQSQVSRACCIGPLLALDILDDDIAANAPKYRRRLTNIALHLLSITAGMHSDQLNRVLKEVTEDDDESWKLVTERINDGLAKGGPGKVAILFLLANWSKEAGKIGSFARSKLTAELKSLDPETGGSLLHYIEGHQEAAQLQSWSRKALTHSAKTNLAEVIKPYFLKVDDHDKAAKRELNKVLRKIGVTEFTMSGVVVRAVTEGPQAHPPLLDCLMSIKSARSLLTAALGHFVAADADPSDFLRTQLRMSIDRARPEWPKRWEDDLA